MKKVGIIISFLILSQIILSQDIISTQGDSYSNTSVRLDFTIGEPVIDTYQNEHNILTQGFHQTKLMVSTIKTFSDDFRIFVSPNPIKDILNIHIEDLQQEFTLEVFDMNSKFLLQKKIINAKSILNFSPYKSGSYILLFRNDENNVVKTFKIQKTH